MVNQQASFELVEGLWQKAISYMGRGAIILAAVGVVAGCGSDTKTPPVKQKPAVVEKTPGENEPSMSPMGSQSTKQGPVVGEVFGQVTLDELKDIQAREAKKLTDPNTEVLPGLTLKQLQANQAEAQKQLQNPATQVFPGMPVDKLRAKQQEAAANRIDPKTEVFPGMTRAQLEAKQGEIKRLDPQSVTMPTPSVKESQAKPKEGVPRSSTPPSR